MALLPIQAAAVAAAAAERRQTPRAVAHCATPAGCCCCRGGAGGHVCTTAGASPGSCSRVQGPQIADFSAGQLDYEDQAQA